MGCWLLCAGICGRYGTLLGCLVSTNRAVLGCTSRKLYDTLSFSLASHLAYFLQLRMEERANYSTAQCASYYHHLTTDAVFNISSDLMMLFIPLPLLIKAKLPLRRKLVLSGVFSLGVFVVSIISFHLHEVSNKLIVSQILSAVLNRYYNFTAGYGSLIYLNWYAGETSTAIIVANVTHCWPLLSRVFSLGSFKSSSLDPHSHSQSRLKFQSVSQSRRRPNHLDTDGYLRSESEERIAGKGAGSWTTQSQSHDMELGQVDGNPYSATATGGDSKEEEMWAPKRDEKSEGIVRTVHIRQYSS